jgi:F-type H+-transporting ATPase subunit epsilon
VLIKTGLEVVVSVRNAIVGHDLNKMKEMVEQEFLQRSEQEQNVRLVLAKIEDDFTRLYREVSQ